jgi:hypothetical protein
MTSLLRNAGVGFILLGVVLVIIWVVEPLRAIWPWLMTFSPIVRVGVVASALGLAILMASLITERIRERDADKKLLDDF